MLLWTASVAIAQSEPEVRRARPVDEPPAARALPAEEPSARSTRSLVEEFSEPTARETERSDQRQLDYANALFTIWRSPNTKSISTIILGVRAGRMRISR